VKKRLFPGKGPLKGFKGRLIQAKKFVPGFPWEGEKREKS